MAANVTTFVKDPQAVLDYKIDLSKWLGPDQITDVTFVADPGLTIDSSSFTTSTVTVWLSGGVVDTTYLVTAHFTTAAGREDDRTFAVRIAEK